MKNLASIAPTALCGALFIATRRCSSPSNRSASTSAPPSAWARAISRSCSAVRADPARARHLRPGDARRRASRSARIAWRGMLFILPAPVFFGLTVRGLGFVPAIFLTAFIASFASIRMTAADGAHPLGLRDALFCHRLQLWARPAVPALRPLAAVLGGTAMELFRQSRPRLRHRNDARESASSA